jgi:hypothetical protein
LSFFALDIFLGYVAFGPKQAYGEVTSAEIQRALTRAATAGVIVQAPIPAQVTAVSFLTLEPWPADRFLMAQKLLGIDRPTVVQESRELTVWSHAGSLVTSLANGVSMYLPAEKPGTIRATDSSGARTLVEDFLKARELLPADARLDWVRQNGPESFVVQFRQDHQGVPIFGGYITANIEKGQISRIRVVWFSPKGLSGKKRALVPATDAIITAVSAGEGTIERGSAIETIALGYLSEPLDARQWDAYPVWRFGFSNGAFVYVNGYSGVIERFGELR